MCALALGASIFAESKRDRVPQRSSTLIAIIFDAVALIYLVWITVDEYIGKPLGLRSPAAKLRLILLDLFFIVFNSANLSLAFDALYDNRWECREDEPDRSGPHNVNLCDRQRALSGVLLIALVAWLLTFSVSVLRYVRASSPSRSRGHAADEMIVTESLHGRPVMNESRDECLLGSALMRRWRPHCIIFPSDSRACSFGVHLHGMAWHAFGDCSGYYVRRDETFRACLVGHVRLGVSPRPWWCSLSLCP